MFLFTGRRTVMGFRAAFGKLGCAARLAAQAAGELTVATGVAVSNSKAATARYTVATAKATGRVLTGRKASRTAKVVVHARVTAATTDAVTSVAVPIVGAVVGAATGQAMRGTGTVGASGDG
jgi:hypothetical protein